jgi:hypothetical protein
LTRHDSKLPTGGTDDDTEPLQVPERLHGGQRKPVMNEWVDGEKFGCL